jgi:hypothetical protein
MLQLKQVYSTELTPPRISILARVALQGPFGMINEELANIYSGFNDELTRRAEKDQLG